MAKKGESKLAQMKQFGLKLFGLEGELTWAEVMEQMREQMREQHGPPIVYPVDLKKIPMGIAGCRRYSFREENQSPNRTIMVLGPTGAGKSTLINGMINYILGVQWEDGFRFKLVNEDESKSQAHSQTSLVSVYKINNQKGFQIPHSLTIIDTPGFGDTRGITRDREITEQLRELFSSKQGVSEIDAVCFVVQASQVRLTATQRYVFDSILSIFGKDIAENIQILVTFADGKKPPVLEGIKLAGIPCPMTPEGLPVHFKFNNSALFAENGDDEFSFDTMYWKIGVNSMKTLFSALTTMTTKSLTMTKEVLKERKTLEIVVEGLQGQVYQGRAKLEEIRQEGEMLKVHEAEINRNENFEIEVPFLKPVQKHKAVDFITNCNVCSVTCDAACTYGDDEDKIKCCAMGSDGKCKVCPKKCDWTLHANQKYTWEYVETKEKRTLDDLKKKYLKASQEKCSVQDVLQGLQNHYKQHQTEVNELVKRSSDCLNRLKEIALKPDPLSPTQYIEMLIKAEENTAKPGYRDRIKILEDMKEQAKMLDQVAAGRKLLG